MKLPSGVGRRKTHICTMWENMVFLIRYCFTEKRARVSAPCGVLSQEKERKRIAELKI